MVRLALFLHSKNGLRRALILVGWLVLYVVFDLALSVVFALMVPSMLLGSVLLGIASLGFAMFALRMGLGKRVWRYHGAEHKAVNAYERGADLADLGAVSRHSRVHDRCGTNLVVIAFLLLMLAYWPLGSLGAGGLLGAILGILIVAVAMEFFRVVTRRPESQGESCVPGRGKSAAASRDHQRAGAR